MRYAEAALILRSIYVVDEDGNFLEFDLDTETFTVLPMATSSIDLIAAVPLGMEIYVLSSPGISSPTETRVYDTIARTWSTGPGSSARHTAAAEAAGRIFAFGDVPGIVESFDPISVTWQNEAALPASITTATSDGTLVYAIAGATAEAWIYDPVGMSWMQAPDLPLPVFGDAAWLDDRVLVTASSDGSAQALDPVGLTWSREGLPRRLRSGPAVAAGGGFLYLFGGETSSPCVR